MVTTYITNSLITLAYYIDDGEYNTSSDCGDLLLSLSEAMLCPKQAHLFGFELFLVYVVTIHYIFGILENYSTVR